MIWDQVSSQEEFDAAVAVGHGASLAAGLTVTLASGSATVQASDSATVRAYGSATVRAYGSATVRASDSATVQAVSPVVTILDHGPRVTYSGGIHVPIPPIDSLETWCERYGLTADDGTVVLFKAVTDAYHSGRGFSYRPGSIPEAPDWDGGQGECGGGLHFSPTPHHALAFHRSAVRYLACPVNVADIRIPRPDDSYPTKVKARGCCAPIWEVDIDGHLLETGEK